jgi:hypothetical protein
MSLILNGIAIDPLRLSVRQFFGGFSVWSPEVQITFFPEHELAPAFVDVMRERFPQRCTHQIDDPNYLQYLEALARGLLERRRKTRRGQS